MNEPTNHWKLGLFVVVGTLMLTAAFIYLGSRSMNKESVSYTSFFDEAVTGLEVGSPVRFRGVTVGKVSRIDVAPDHRHVEVAYDLVVSVLGRLRLAADRGQQTKITVPVDLRAQLGQTGVTGVKYVLIDFFDPLTHPPPQLSFRPPERYIPATPSTLKDIEEAVVRAIDEFPKIAEQSQHVIAQLDTILASLAEQRVPEHAVATLAQVDQTLTVMRKKLDEVDVKQLSSDTHATLASLQRASDSIGDMTRGSRNYSQDFASALRELRSAAESFRQLAEAVELDPDMLVKGRARGRR